MPFYSNILAEKYQASALTIETRSMYVYISIYIYINCKSILIIFQTLKITFGNPCSV